jgi:outer membrane protein, multidrug efflux system
MSPDNSKLETGSVRSRISVYLRLSAVISLAAVAACTVGPDYVRPEVDTPKAFRFEPKDAQDLANTAWWKQFQDPVLDALIDEGLANSKDLRIAAARVEQFAGRLTTTRSQFYPQIGYGAGASRDRISERLATPLTPSISNPQTTYSAVLSASWEIDLFGRIQRLSEAAQAQLMATEEARRGVVLSLVSGVATGYIALRDFDKQLVISKRTAETRREALALFELRYGGGVVSKVEVAQVRSEYESAVAVIPAVERAIAQTENALSILVGRNPGPIMRGKSVDELREVAVPGGIPSDLLVRRPDIQEAEQNLIAANANIGAARALYYPRISLTGLFGYASTDLGDLLQGPARQWSFAGSLAGPIFTFGLIEGQVAASEAQQRQLLANYERTIQNAFREVDDALIDNRKSRERLDAQDRQVAALNDYARLARLRYHGGFTSYLEVLDAERSLFNAELQRTLTQGEVFTALVNIYKSMGGGWINIADKTAPQPSIGTARDDATRP